jgi:Glycosyl hydrolases family 39
VRRRYLVGLIALAGVLAVVGAGLILVRATTASTSAPAPVGAWPGWGFTHTQYSADHGPASATQSVEQALAAQPLVQAQAIMGWGADNPEPSPGEYDFGSLDRRIDLIRQSGGVPVITLCCAPDWMKGGHPGDTDWDHLTDAPLPEHYGDFADLAAVIARRYPDVQHYLVWNEFKGFWHAENNTWDAEGYTRLYNDVRDALKNVNPRIQVGGPYLDMSGADGAAAGRPPKGTPSLSGAWGSVDPRVLEAFHYFLTHARGADFIVVDGHAAARGTVDPFAALAKFGAVNRWIRQQTDRPIWWAEWYVDPVVENWPADQQVAVYTAAMMELARSGTRTALYWNPAPGDESCATCLWTDTATADGGRPLPFLTDTLQNFARWFPPGTKLQDVDAPHGLLVLAQARAMVVVNTTDSPVSATLQGREVSLPPYGTTWLTDL